MTFVITFAAVDICWARHCRLWLNVIIGAVQIALATFLTFNPLTPTVAIWAQL